MKRNRRSNCHSLLGRCLLLVLATGFPSSLMADDWPVFRGTPESTGVSNSKLPAEPGLLWEYQVPKGGFGATPIIVNGRIYVGDYDGIIYCLKLENGEVLWTQKTEGGFVAGAAVIEQTLVIGDIYGTVYGLNIQDGKQNWTYEVSGPVVSGINIYGKLALVTSEGGSLYAIDSQSGTLAWEYSAGKQLQSAPTVAGNRSFLGGCDSNLHVVNLDTGKADAPLLPVSGPTASTPAVHDNIAMLPLHSGHVLGLNWRELKQDWVFEDSDPNAEIKTSPALTEKLVFVTTRNKRVLALNRLSGTVEWEAVLRKRCDTSPVICDGRVWVVAADGRLIAMQLETGKQTWMTELGGTFLASPAIADNRLVVCSDNGTIFCFGDPSQ